MMVDKLTETLTDNTETDVTTEQCVSAISALLRVTLDSKHTTPTLQEFLLSHEVVTLVRAMVTVTGSVDYIIQAVTMATTEEGVGFEYFIQYIAKLLASWIDLQSGPLNVKPGFIPSLLSIVMKSSSRQWDACGNHALQNEVLDKDLHSIVKLALGSETTESINTVYESSYKYQALHIFASTYRLPSVTRELLKHPGIDVNARTLKGETPLVYLVMERRSPNHNHLDVFSILMSDPDIDVSIDDYIGKSVVDHLSHHLTAPESDTSVILQMIQQVCHHKTVTTNMTQTAFYRVLHMTDLDDGLMHSDVLETVKYIITSPKFSVKSSKVYNQTAIEIILDRLSKSEHQHKRSLLLTILKEVTALPECTDIDYSKYFVKFNQFANTATEMVNQQIIEIVLSLIDQERLNVNEWIEGETTAGHLAAKAGNIQLTELIISHPRFDPNIVDGFGNTVLFYICEHSPSKCG